MSVSAAEIVQALVQATLLLAVSAVVVPVAGVNLWTLTPRGPDDLGAVVDVAASCP